MALEKFISNLENTPTKLRNPKCKENITRQQRASIKKLSENNNIVIKEADKGGAVVIMDRDPYKEMAYEILQNREYYELLDSDLQRSNNLKYKRFLKKHEHCFTQKEDDYLRNFEVKESNFYGLPKVHKSLQITSECNSS